MIDLFEMLIGEESWTVAGLEGLYQRISPHPGFLEQSLSALVQLEEENAWCACWLLRRAAKDYSLPEPVLVALVDSLGVCTHWIARLTICQLFASTPCPDNLREELFPFLSECFADRRVIVRAWAISGLWGFRSDPRYGETIADFVSQARKDPSKAMQARLRHL